MAIHTPSKQSSTTAPQADHEKHLRQFRTKALVGVDAGQAYVPVLELLARLRFDQPNVTLLHAVNTTCPITNADAHTESEYSKVVQNLGLRALDLSVDEACVRDLHAKTKMVFGRAADSLMREATADSDDLIAVCATKHGAWSNGYMGSATCALALNATQSLLICKKPIGHKHGLKVVFAVDHSTKTDGIVDKFLRLAPRGIDEILLVSSYEIDDETAAAAHKNLPMLGGDIDRWLSESLQEKNEAVAKRLTDAGYKVQTKVVCRAAGDALHDAMQVFRGDLLIMGATGSGSVAGAKVGSVALHQISSEPYSVLMIRDF